jgi:hypothetical protein
MKYLCLACEEESKLNALSRKEWDALREATLRYVEELREKGHLIVAEPLQSASTAVSVRVRNGNVSTTDGPFAETKEQLGGIFLINAGSMDEALGIAAGWPSAQIGTIEVRPIEPELSAEGRYARL